MPIWIFLVFIAHTAYSVQIKKIPNARLDLFSAPSLNITHDTKESCLCAMVLSSIITAVNYFSNNTCQLYSNQSMMNAKFTYSIDLTSSFYFLQSPTLSPFSNCALGTTVFGNTNGTPGSSSSTLQWPWGISINRDTSLVIVDQNTERALLVSPSATTSVVIANNVSRFSSTKAMYDSQLLNLYFMDYSKCSMRKTYNRSITSIVLFGGTCGSNSTLFENYAGFTMDSAGNFYIADNLNHRVLYWPSNSASSIIIAGVTGIAGNDTQHLYYPQDVALNETQGVIYVDDSYNNRIVRFNIGSPNGTVVAGGNGLGNARNQLNHPTGFCISKKTNAIYIADMMNNRIVRWFVGDSQGTVIAGSCNGTSSTSLFSLLEPTSVALDNDEMYLYVSDTFNNRIQRFTLV